MRKDEVVALIRSSQAELERYDVKSLRLFGSVARDEAEPGSDVDVLVEFKSAPTFDSFMGLKIFLEDLFGVRVDLVTEDGLHPMIRDAVLRAAIPVA